MDQCTHCECRGDINRCLGTVCSYHDLWMVEEIKRLTNFSFDHIAQEPANQADREGVALMTLVCDHCGQEYPANYI